MCAWAYLAGCSRRGRRIVRRVTTPRQATADDEGGDHQSDDGDGRDPRGGNVVTQMVVLIGA